LTYPRYKQLLKSFRFHDVGVVVEKRRGELEKGERDSGGLSKRRWIAKSEDVSFDLERKGWDMLGGGFGGHEKQVDVRKYGKRRAKRVLKGRGRWREGLKRSSPLLPSKRLPSSQRSQVKSNFQPRSLFTIYLDLTLHPMSISPLHFFPPPLASSSTSSSPAASTSTSEEDTYQSLELNYHQRRLPSHKYQYESWVKQKSLYEDLRTEYLGILESFVHLRLLLLPPSPSSPSPF